MLWHRDIQLGTEFPMGKFPWSCQKVQFLGGKIIITVVTCRNWFNGTKKSSYKIWNWSLVGVERLQYCYMSQKKWQREILENDQVETNELITEWKATNSADLLHAQKMPLWFRGCWSDIWERTEEEGSWWEEGSCISFPKFPDGGFKTGKM